MSDQPQFPNVSVLDDCIALNGIEMEVKIFPTLDFASIGYPCIALSLRGTSKTPYKTGKDEGVKNKVKIDQHVEDLLIFLEYIHNRVHNKQLKDGDKQDCRMKTFFESLLEQSEYRAPIVFGHSFGGLTIMKLLERIEKVENQAPLLSSVSLICSVPPSGITKMSMRAVRRNPIKGWRIMRGLAMKRAVFEEKLCRLLFFDDKCSDEQLKRYITHFQEDSKVTIDLRDLSNKLPILAADNGHSTCIQNGVLSYKPLVIGGVDDYIVDSNAVYETAKFLSSKSTKCECVMVQGAVHDVMLASCWGDVAKQMELWLNSIVRLSNEGELAQ